MSDRRYGSHRWKRVRKDVLRRDRHRCFVPACGAWADTCDHIRPVYPGMSDVEFYAMDNLRAACRPHNVARGFAARLERDLRGEPEPARDSFGSLPGGTITFRPKPRIG